MQLAYAAMKQMYALAWRTRQGALGFVGDYRQGVTPVPIPNTEVKTLSPMILLSGKVGDCRLNGLCRGNSTEPIFIFAMRGVCACVLFRLPDGLRD